MANEKNLIPAKPGERRAAKPDELHAKNRTIRFTDSEWDLLQGAADESQTKRSEFIRRAAMSALAQDMSEKTQKMYCWLLSKYIESNSIESLDELFDSEYELELDRVFTDEAPTDSIRDAALFAFRD